MREESMLISAKVLKNYGSSINKKKVNSNKNKFMGKK